MKTQNFPIFVIDSPDGCGKSTLAQEFVKEFDAKHLHLTYRFKDRMPEYHLAAFDLALRYSQRRPVVLDRWWPSEIVYSHVFRGGHNYGYYTRMLDRLALRHAVQYIFCMPPDKESYLAHFNKVKQTRQEMFDDMSKVYDGYAALISTLAGHPFVQTWHYSIKDCKSVTDLYLEGLAHLVDVPKQLRVIDDVRFAGNPSARVLLVGDASNRHTRRGSYPFVANHGCSPWFTNHLQNIGVKEQDLGWLNLHDDNGKVQWTHAELKIFSEARLVALGANVQHSLTNLGLDFERAPHPQYLKRFHSKTERYPRLVELFRDLEVISEYG